MSLDNLDDVLGGGGGTTAFTKDTPMGTTFRGPIIDAVVQQIKDIRDGKPKTWDDGRPQQQIVIRIQTDHRLDDEDDGIRSLYVKTWGVWKQALVEAQTNGGFERLSEALAPGNIFSDTYYGDKAAASAGLSPTKLHRYEIVRVSSPALDIAVNQATGELLTATAPAPVASVAPVAVVAPPVAAAPVVPAAAAPPVSIAPDPVETARQLIALGLPDNVIAAQTGIADVVLAALRGQAA